MVLLDRAPRPRRNLGWGGRRPSRTGGNDARGGGALALAMALVSGTAALAEIRIVDARIAGGELRVTGIVAPRSDTVIMDDDLSVQTDARGRSGPERRDRAEGGHRSARPSGRGGRGRADAASRRPGLLHRQRLRSRLRRGRDRPRRELQRRDRSGGDGCGCDLPQPGRERLPTAGLREALRGRSGAFRAVTRSPPRKGGWERHLTGVEALRSSPRAALRSQFRRSSRSK